MKKNIQHHPYVHMCTHTHACTLVYTYEHALHRHVYYLHIYTQGEKWFEVIFGSIESLRPAWESSRINPLWRMDKDCKHENDGAGTGEGAKAFLMLKEVSNREHLKMGH